MFACVVSDSLILNSTFRVSHVECMGSNTLINSFMAICFKLKLTSKLLPKLARSSITNNIHFYSSIFLCLPNSSQVTLF